MFITIQGLEIFYKRYDGKGLPTVILHGWGANCDVMQNIFNSLKENNKSVIMLDLPYFGKSQIPPETFGIYEYANMVEEFIIQMGFSIVNIIGHSFGGRLGIILSSTSNIITVNKLILTDAAGLKPRRSLKYYFKVYLYKLKKMLRIKSKKAGSSDYKQLPESMKKVFVRVVNTHLDKLCSNIKSETLIIWGRNDKDTPIYMANKLNKKIKNSGLVILEDAGHFSFLDKSYDYNIIVNTFLDTK